MTRPVQDESRSAREATQSVSQNDAPVETAESVERPLQRAQPRMRGEHVEGANQAARSLLGDQIVGRDVRFAIRHPLALDRIFAGRPTDLELVGVGSAERPWQMTVRAVPGGVLVRLSDRSAFRAAERMRTDSPAAVHVDGTARPQLVTATSNPSFHRIISEYYRLSGIPSVINTSFNMHEEPIVCTPDDAIRAFLQGNLDYLAIGDCLVAHPSSRH